MTIKELTNSLKSQIATSYHPREMVVDVIYSLQHHFGYFSDEALEIAVKLLDMSAIELEELATFYTFIYRKPVGKFVIHVCDSTICWMEAKQALTEHLLKRLNVNLGETSKDGFFTVLPVCCIGYCDRAPAILINRKAYGPLTPESLDMLIDQLRRG